jgi:hypothetical protein
MLKLIKKAQDFEKIINRRFLNHYKTLQRLTYIYICVRCIQDFAKCLHYKQTYFKIYLMRIYRQNLGEPYDIELSTEFFASNRSKQNSILKIVIKQIYKLINNMKYGSVNYYKINYNFIFKDLKI